MREDRVGRLRLEGEDATYFINSFFYPSAEDIAAHEARIDRINRSISVSRNDSGFEAEIDELDLSFLDDELEEEQLEIIVKVTVQVTEDLFYSNLTSDLTQAKAGTAVNNTFSAYEAYDWLNIAA